MTIKYKHISNDVNNTLNKIYELIKIKVDIGDLKFNPYNDRFAMEIYEYNSKNNSQLGLDDSSQDFLKNLLWNKNKIKNQNTKNDILKKGVLKDIYIDEKGIILDGNRRISILKKIIHDNEKLKLSNDKLDSFQNPTVILIKKQLSEEEIRDIESTLQISEDEKVDYDPINMYLKINRLFQIAKIRGQDDEKNYENISRILGPKYPKNKIKKHYSVFKVMESYLRYIGKPKGYTYLINKEDHFKHIDSFIKSYQKGTINFDELVTSLNKSKEEIFLDIKELLFQVTSSHLEGKIFRKLVPTSRSNKSPLLYKIGLNKVMAYAKNNMIKDEKLILNFTNDEKIDFAINNIISQSTRIKNTKNHFLAIQDQMKTIQSNINIILNWKDSLPNDYKVNKKVIKIFYEKINELKEIVRDYEENSEI